MKTRNTRDVTELRETPNGGSQQRMARTFKDFLPKLPRAKRGRRFGLAIHCMKMDMQILIANNDVMDRISVKDYEDAIQVLEAHREKQPHRPIKNSAT